VYSDPKVEAGQVRAGTPVGSGPEGQVSVGLAFEVEGIRIRELRFVPIG
jgi:hypothetical protein